MRIKHKSTVLLVLLFSCPMGYSNMYWFESAVSLPKKQSPFYQRLPNISQSYQTKLNTHSLSLSFSKLQWCSHGFSLWSDLTLFFARRIGSQHKAKEDPSIAMLHSSSSSPVTYLSVHFTFPASFFSVSFSRKLKESIYQSVFVFFSLLLFLLAWISGFLSAELSLFRCFATVAGI